MLRDLQEKEGPQNRPDVYDVNSWVVLPQHGKGYYVVNMYSLETNWSQWRAYKKLMEVTI